MFLVSGVRRNDERGFTGMTNGGALRPELLPVDLDQTSQRMQ